MRRKLLLLVLVCLIVIVGVLFAVSLNLLKPVPGGAEMIGENWDFSTYWGGSIHNETAYGYSSLVFSVNSTVGSEVSMLSHKTEELPVASHSMIRTSVSNCKIDWGWLGLGNNYMFLTWNGTRWIADTGNGNEISEVTVINGYSPSDNWRKLSIEATSTEVRYLIDDAVVATHTSKIPTGDLQFYGELESTGTASKLYIASHTF